jgi:hypothetical protein
MRQQNPLFTQSVTYLEEFHSSLEASFVCLFACLFLQKCAPSFRRHRRASDRRRVAWIRDSNKKRTAIELSLCGILALGSLALGKVHSMCLRRSEFCATVWQFHIVQFQPVRICATTHISSTSMFFS